MKLFVASLLALATMANGDPVLRVNLTHKGETEAFCFTKEQTDLLAIFKEWQQSADDSLKDYCGEMKVDVINYPVEALPQGDGTGVDVESLKRAFHFTELSPHSNHELPMPMIKRFKETKINVKGEEIDIPQDIKEFFRYTVVRDEENQKEAIAGEDSADKHHVGVAGKYGSRNIPNYGLKDEFLNPCSVVANSCDGEYDAKTVNNPRELIRVLKAAEFLNYQVLLKYASAKFATLISLNTVYRNRALLGFEPHGDYTEQSYYNGDGEKVEGIEDIKEKNSWFDMDNDTRALYKEVIEAYTKEKVKYLDVTDAMRNEKTKKEIYDLNDLFEEDVVKTNDMLPDTDKITDIYD